MQISYKLWPKAILAITLGFCLTTCINNSTVAESEYSTEIIGSWEGTIGELKEIMSLKRDSTFVCYIQPVGFIANTLSQSRPDIIRGKWQITGAEITMKVTSEKNAHVQNRVTSSTIVVFKQDSLVLKSEGGSISVFKRMIKLRKKS